LPLKACLMLIGTGMCTAGGYVAGYLGQVAPMCLAIVPSCLGVAEVYYA
jgi:hypothetical protein